MKKTKKIIFWVLTIGYLLFSLAFVSDKHFYSVCKEINVNIIDSIENSFIHENDIVKLLTKRSQNYIGTPLGLIDTEEIEKKISDHPSVINAEVYKTINGSINVIIDQRNPVIRIYTKSGSAFYIDEDGAFMPLSDNYASQVVIANGEIKADIQGNTKQNVFSLHDKTLKDLYLIGKFLKKDEFWNSQVEQVYVTKRGEFELIPRVGSHVILLGSVDDMERKLHNLREVYKEGFSKESWIKYKYINLKYKNQVICTKR